MAFCTIGDRRLSFAKHISVKKQKKSEHGINITARYFLRTETRNWRLEQWTTDNVVLCILSASRVRIRNASLLTAICPRRCLLSRAAYCYGPSITTSMSRACIVLCTHTSCTLHFTVPGTI